MRLRAASSSIRTWYSLTLAMVKEMTSGSSPAPTMFWGSQRHQSRLTSPSTCGGGATLGVGTTAGIVWRRVLMTRLDVMSQEPSYMTWSIL
jgi:hypothetical protein